MKSRYRIFRRKSTYYIQDNESGRQTSLRTKDKKEAQRLLIAHNEAQDNRLLNFKIAEAHLAAQDPAMTKRTWQDVINALLDRQGEVRESTLRRARGAFRSKPFDIIRNKKLVQTVSEDFLKVLKSGSTSTNVWLRVLHNHALRMDWLLRRVLSEGAWPVIRYGTTRGITEDEHNKIITAEKNPERRAFYEVFWHW